MVENTESEAVTAARYVIHIRPDRMAVELELLFWPPQGDPGFGVVKLKEELSQRKVVFGFDESGLERAVAEVERLAATGGGGKIRLAEGQPPVNGGNGRLEYKVGEGAVNPDPAAAELVRPGQVLVLRVAAEPGTPGRNVFGEEVAAKPGYEPALSVGDNVRLAEDGLTYLATVYGRVTMAGGLLAVTPLVEISADGMGAWLPIYPQMADGSRLEYEDLVCSLKAAGVVHGIMEGAIKAVLEQEVALPRFLAAKGDLPVDGRDAVVVFHFTLNDDDPLRVEAERLAGKIDPARLRKSLLKSGETVAERTPPVAAIPGRRVTGEDIAGREPRDTPLAGGDNVIEIGEGPILAVAETLVAGYADYREGVVSVADPLQVSADEMAVLLEIHPPDRQGRGLGGELLLKMLAALQVTHGVRKNTIRRAVEFALTQKRVLHGVVAARGREPVNGRDAYIEVMIKRGKSAGRIAERTDSIEFRERDTINSVKKGETLARRTPPESGIDGWTVRGMPLFAKAGADLQFQPQPNVAISEDGLSLLSELDGMVTILADNKIAVFQVYEVKGDVDYRVGNLEMAGALVISGWVRPGFTVKASGEIQVGGGVEDAILIAGGGVEIKGGMTPGARGVSRPGVMSRSVFWSGPESMPVVILPFRIRSCAAIFLPVEP